MPHTLCGPITGWIGSARQFTFLDRFTAVGLESINQNETSEEKRWVGPLVSLSLSLFRLLMMSSSFSAHDPHDDLSSNTQSFIDLSPSSIHHTHTHRSSRARSASVDSEKSTMPLNPQRSEIRINTSLVVRICVSDSLFSQPLINSTFGSFSSLAPARETPTAYNTQA